jgi:hypothetical protein
MRRPGSGGMALTWLCRVAVMGAEACAREEGAAATGFPVSCSSLHARGGIPLRTFVNSLMAGPRRKERPLTNRAVAHLPKEHP